MELGISTWVKFLLFCLHEQNKQNRGWHCWRMSSTSRPFGKRNTGKWEYAFFSVFLVV